MCLVRMLQKQMLPRKDQQTDFVGDLHRRLAFSSDLVAVPVLGPQ